MCVNLSSARHSPNLARTVTFVNENSFKVSNLDLVVHVKNDEWRAISKVTPAFECFRQAFLDYNFESESFILSQRDFTETFEMSRKRYYEKLPKIYTLCLM